MISYKTADEIEIMREGGEKLKRVVARLRPAIRVGVKTNELDRLAEKYIREEGGEPSFQRVQGYKWSTCLPVNEQVVHTPPSERALKDGDVLTLDIGVFYRGFHTDYADTVIVGKSDGKTAEFLDVGKKALSAALKEVKPGNRLGDISGTIESMIRGKGYGILRELTGHGIGRELHEDPFVLGYLDKPREKTLEIKPGLVIAVEVIYARSTEEIAYEKEDGWSITSADKSLTACFEHTVAVKEKEAIILT